MCDPHHVTHPDPRYARELKKDGDAFMMAAVMCHHISMKREHHDLSVFNALHGLCFVTCRKERWALLLENLSGLEQQDVCILLKLAFVTFQFFKL